MKSPCTSVVASRNNQSLVHLRIRVCAPAQQEFISKLSSDYGLTVQVIRLKNCHSHQLDLELHGSIPQMQAGLAYLASVSLAIQGKPNPDGDSWNY